jgi:predicted secreted protein
MNKKIITVLLALAMLSSSAAFAAGESGSGKSNNNQGVIDQESQKSHKSFSVKFDEITDEGSLMKTENAEGDEIDFIIGGSVFYDNTGAEKKAADLKKGDEITVFVDAKSPAPLIMPQRYMACAVVLDTDEIGFVDVSKYSNKEGIIDKFLVNADNTLAINIGDDTAVVGKDGKAVDRASIKDGASLMVFYAASTKSIPAQTTPSKVVVLNTEDMDNGPDDGDKEPNVSKGEYKFKTYYITSDVTDNKKVEVSDSEEGETAQTLDLSEALIINNDGSPYEKLNKGNQITVYSELDSDDIEVAAVLKDEKYAVDVDEYVKSAMFGVVTNKANTLALNLDKNTNIVDMKGNKVSYKKLYGCDLIVIYKAVALSNPGQTSPEKVIVLDDDVYFDDIDLDDDFYDAVKYLVHAGIVNGYEDGKFYPNKTLTRAELTKIIYAAMVYAGEDEGDLDDAEELFEDVLESDWYAPYINRMYKLNKIDGVGDKKFEPNKKVTYEQAIKMIVSFMGKDQEAQDKGGYPEGYTAVAMELGITEGISIVGNKPITRRDAVVMVDRAVDYLDDAGNDKDEDKDEDKDDDRDDDKDDKTFVECKVTDGKLYIELDANATTGYEWIYHFKKDGIISLEDSEYITDKHEPGMVGVGGVQKFIFKGDKKGKTEINLEYKRASSEDAAKTVEVNVEVDKDGNIIKADISDIDD